MQFVNKKKLEELTFSPFLHYEVKKKKSGITRESVKNNIIKKIL